MKTTMEDLGIESSSPVLTLELDLIQQEFL